MSSGHGIRRYRGQKRTYRDQDLGPLVEHEMNRCIHCYRCSRFYQEFAGYRDLGAMQIGDRTYFGRVPSGTLESPFSGNLADICPTGVYTDKPSRYFGRRWDFQRSPAAVHPLLARLQLGDQRALPPGGPPGGALQPGRERLVRLRPRAARVLLRESCRAAAAGAGAGRAVAPRRGPGPRARPAERDRRGRRAAGRRPGRARSAAASKRSPPRPRGCTGKRAGAGRPFSRKIRRRRRSRRRSAASSRDLRSRCARSSSRTLS